MTFRTTLEHLERLFHDRYDLASTIRHRGERGRQREHDLARFLRDNLPTAYGVATGEIITFTGTAVSPQCDIIIYDQLHTPVIGRDEPVQRVPIEGVYVVIECRSSLDNSALKEAHQRFQAIRSLPHSKHRARPRAGMVRGPRFELFGYQLQTPHQNCLDFVSRQRRHDTSCTALDSGTTLWIEGRRDPIWLEATRKDQQRYQTLAFFFVGLLETLRSIDLGNPRFVDILLSEY